MNKNILHLEYGINLHADHVYDTYTPTQVTAAYPDPTNNEVREALSKYTGLPAEMIICGNGSDELIDLYLRINKLDDSEYTIAVAPPMYYQYPVYAARVGISVINLPHDRTQISAALLKEKGAIPEHTSVILDNPSNPAGDVVAREQIVELLEAGFKVFVDEAYYEFYGHSVSDLISTYPDQLVVSRTLSKFCAMAGSRFGYILADVEITKKFAAHRMLFTVNHDAQHRALFALKHLDEFKKAVSAIKASREYITTAIANLGNYELFSSLDLFVIFKHHTIPSAQLHQQLSESFNIKTYLFDNFKGNSVIRAASAKQADMKQLVDALATFA